MDQTQDSSVDPGVLDYLTSLLSPNSAEAAPPSSISPEMQQRAFEQRQAALLADQRRKDMLTALQMQKIQQSQAAALQKQNAKSPDTLMSALQPPQQQPAPAAPGQGGPQAPFSFGQDPRTGQYVFNNLGFVGGQGQLPDWATQGRVGEVAQRYSSPQAQQDVTQYQQQQEAARQQAAQAAAAQSSGIPPVADRQRHALIMDTLKSRIGESAAKAQADLAVPSMAQYARQQELDLEKSKLGVKADAEATKPVPPRDRPLYYNQYGDILEQDPNRNQYKTEADLANAGYSRAANAAALNTVTAGKAAHLYFDTLEKLQPKVLQSIEKYKQQAKYSSFAAGMGMLSTIELNKLALNIAAASGDPDARQWQSLHAPTAVLMGRLEGIPGGRESVRMLEQMGTQIPGSKDSLESSKRLLEAGRTNIEALTGIKRKAGDAAVAPSKVATRMDVGQAMKDAGGNRQQALQLLKQRGFTEAQ